MGTVRVISEAPFDYRPFIDFLFFLVMTIAAVVFIVVKMIRSRQRPDSWVVLWGAIIAFLLFDKGSEAFPARGAVTLYSDGATIRAPGEEGSFTVRRDQVEYLVVNTREENQTDAVVMIARDARAYLFYVSVDESPAVVAELTQTLGLIQPDPEKREWRIQE